MTDKAKLWLVFIGILITFVVQLIVGSPMEAEAGPVTTEDLRLRVIAESDDPGDQVVKRVAVFAVEDFMNQHANGYQVEFLSDNLAEIRATIEDVLAELGIEIDVEVSFGQHYFPSTSGYYASLVVRLGNAMGANWWCFINPGICVVPTAETATPNTAQVEIREEVQASFGTRALNFVSRLFGGGESSEMAEGAIDWFLFADER